MNIINPVTFIDKLIKRNELAQPFRLTDHQRKILRLAFALTVTAACRGIRFFTAASRRAARLPSTDALMLAWGFTQEPPNEI